MHADATSTTTRLVRSIAYLERCFDSQLHVPTLAKLAGFSPSHYSVLFKTHTGYAPIKYLTQLRMQRARELLVTTSDSIKAIAMTVGYRDQLYFSRVFRALHHSSPGDYRRSREDGGVDFWRPQTSRRAY